MNNTIKTTCQKCGQSIEADVIYCGETAQCPSCGAPVQLPELPESPMTYKKSHRVNPAVLPPYKPIRVWDCFLYGFAVFIVALLLKVGGGFPLYIFPACIIIGYLAAILRRLLAIEEAVNSKH